MTKIINSFINKSTNDLTNGLASKFNAVFSSRLFFSVRGADNVHIYLWILKDLFWSLGYVYAGTTFGLLALLWLTVMFYNSFGMKNTQELYYFVPLFLWLYGNFWWMRSEFSNPYDSSVGREQGGYIMLAGMAIAQIYFIIFKCDCTKKWLKNNEASENLYQNHGYIPSISFFENWRQYEFFHVMCWIGKDISWNFLIKPMWLIFVCFTLIVSLDFIRVSLKNKKLAVDLTHYIVQFMWLCANIVWSSGELFSLTTDDIHSLFITDPLTCRWISSVILLCSYIPIIILYTCWIILSYRGKINEADDVIQGIATHQNETGLELL
jgi:hypothetical protein